MLCDAHLHLANLSAKIQLAPLFESAKSVGITAWLSNALFKAELSVYESLMQQPQLNLQYSAGIHPFWKECDLEYEDIADLAQKRKIWAIGEIGLDRANKSFEAMRQIFIDQLSLAADCRLPVVLHIVGHQQEAYNILQKHALRYLMHGYAGHVVPMESFLKLDCYFTISERIVRQDKRELLRLILESGRYLFETDIAADYVEPGEENPLLRLIEVVEKSAEISGIAINELIEVQAVNYEKLTGMRL